MRAFITGSHAYGTPNKDSDIDLVVLLDSGQADAASILWEGQPKGKSCRFGRLNLITFIDESRFLKWKEVTRSLAAQRPVTREVAIEAFKNAGFVGYGK